jgi:hypothetical protein
MTDELIDELASDSRPVGRFELERRAMLAAGVGLMLALAAMALWLGLRPDLAQAVGAPAFWIKLGFTALVAMAALALCCRLVRPGCSARLLALAAAAPFVAVIVAGVVELALAPAPARPGLWLGDSWSVCPIRIVVLAAPVLVAVLWTFRRFAPTRLRLAGFAAGLVAGGLGAFAYAFNCTETATAFLATWYVLGILAVAAIGALLGPRVLAW